MKAHEETWRADDQGYLRNEKGDCIFIGDAMGDGLAEPARAKLAAQAPAMARELRGLYNLEGKPIPFERITQILRDAGVLP